MKIIPLLAALIVLTCASAAVAQSVNYSFDNFDTRNGVQIHVDPPTALVLPNAKRGPRAKRSHATAQDSVSTNVRSTMLPANPSVLSSDPAGLASSLRGFTTGNAEVDGYIIDSAQRNKLDPLLLYSIMHQESSFKRRAISPKGARGLMQLMPGTAARFGVTNIFDPKQNIEGGARYVNFLINRFNGDLSLTLAGYNAGEGAVDKYGWRVPPYAETQEYVRRISRRYNLLRDPNAALYAPSLSRSQVAKLNEKTSTPLNIYERSVLTVRLPDGRLQLLSQ
ncbi:MAG TPA: lytic transglycosylase domain-containing protein [Pyrinomonadaceae bacterium]|nr:lytic transglycosylase domain-containing protein [Pyrinomonadaceae bacterium]